MTQWLWGFLTHMRQRGRCAASRAGAYAQTGTCGLCQVGGGASGCRELGEHTPRPVFLTLGQHRDFDRLAGERAATWFDRWASATLGRQMLLPRGWPRRLYRLRIRGARVDSGVLCARRTTSGDSLALNPEALVVDYRRARSSPLTGSKRR